MSLPVTQPLAVPAAVPATLPNVVSSTQRLTAPLSAETGNPPGNSPDTTVDLQAAALIEDIGRQVAAQRQALLDAATREAEQIRHLARTKARTRLRRAIDDMRSTERQRTQQLLAEIETASRRQASSQAQHTLSLAWPSLAQALLRRWNDPSARTTWITAQLALARTRLPASGWTVRHPSSLTTADVTALRETLQRQGIDDASLQADATLQAGLVIEVGGARLDSTPAALLADRSMVEAALLAVFDPPAEPGCAR